MKQILKKISGIMAIVVCLIGLSMATVAKENNTGIQYNYNETDAQSVNVSVTISNDGYPLLGNDEDETILANLPVTVPYFDLKAYGLERFYRYGTENGEGDYVQGTELIKRPTALHLYIYLLERYYLGLPEEDCGKGALYDSTYLENRYKVSYMNYEEAYGASEYHSLTITGAATSMYMNEFWGHSENLMYYRNHVYPLMEEGKGSTADYILLSDGDTIDLGMFTDFEFYKRGAFLSFAQENYEVETGVNTQFDVRASFTREGIGADDTEETSLQNVVTELYDADWKLVKGESQLMDQKATYRFEKPGTYYLMVRDGNAMTEEACYTPGIAKIVVTGEEVVHVHEYGEPVFVWGVDADTCKVTTVCKDDSCKEKYTADAIVEKSLVKKAGFDAKGEAKVVAKATIDGKSYEDTGSIKIPAVQKPSLAQSVYCYNGKEIAPPVSIVNSLGDALAKDVDYQLVYDENAKTVGRHQVKVTLVGNYEGELSLSYFIQPKGTTITSLKSKSKKTMTVKWKKNAAETSGYQLRYSKTAKFGKSKTITVSSTKSVSKKIKKLKSKTKYYVQIRTFKKTKAGIYYSSWSSVKKVKVK